MICMTRGFGAPVIDAGGNAARIRAPDRTPGRRVPRTVVTRWYSPGCASTSQRFDTLTEPYSQMRPRSFLVRSTIMTFSARSFGLSANAVASAPVPLIGRDST